MTLTLPDAGSVSQFFKGHGTQNDFVLLYDPAATLELTPDAVAALCDRQRGIGADGLLRVARAGELVARGVLDAHPDDVAPDDWFMDYRNADGSIAEMCGNGVRVFAHFCRATGLVESDVFTVGSRAGGRVVTVHSYDDSQAEVSVEMGRVRIDGESSATIDGVDYPGVVVDVGNPHLAAVVEGLSIDALAELDFIAGADIDAGVYPHGANVEILTPPVADGDVYRASMRVIERGVGETRSCGTGLVAAGAAALRSLGRDTGELRLTVPGGQVTVIIADDGATLRGPSRLVARGALIDGWERG
ncbi:diaminopimelate epimerase [Gordonia effusa NBRC 100432]|uniref:Diaminopimelate epimerase n=1 Tax=Gordonia effusa NBRC 100432 TaxID=1077974 RepID=H0QYQ6_9ACTN|nr:diaminopimelate epimerase [Gordonia effusa]GAB17957.1 diaminopimelate epimerase [Gordonia effusa NBRC 100432]